MIGISEPLDWRHKYVAPEVAHRHVKIHNRTRKQRAKQPGLPFTAPALRGQRAYAASVWERYQQAEALEGKGEPVAPTAPAGKSLFLHR
jgi:hypothetical protein